MRYHFNLHRGTFGQRGDLNRGTGWKIPGEIAGVNLIHRCKVAEVGHEHRAFENICKGQSLIVQNGLHVFQHALGLRFDVAGHQIAGGGFNWNLPGAEKQIAGTDGMVIRTHGGRRCGGLDDLFGGHSSGAVLPL